VFRVNLTQIRSAVPKIFHTNKKTRAKEVFYEHKPHAATMEWSRLLLHDVICSEHVTMHFQWGGNLYLVTLSVDLDIQTRPSEGPNTSSM